MALWRYEQINLNKPRIQSWNQNPLLYQFMPTWARSVEPVVDIIKPLRIHPKIIRNKSAEAKLPVIVVGVPLKARMGLLLDFVPPVVFSPFVGITFMDCETNTSFASSLITRRSIDELEDSISVARSLSWRSKRSNSKLQKINTISAGTKETPTRGGCFLIPK